MEKQATGEWRPAYTAPNPALMRAQTAQSAAQTKAEAGPPAPSGYRWSTTKPGELESIKGGPADPETKAAAKAVIQLAGGRESVYTTRVVQAANQASKDLSNIVLLPLSSSTSILGGRRQGPGLLDAGKEVLAQKLTSQDAQTYNVIATGLQRSLASVETSGLAQGIQEFSKTMDVVAKEGDTQLTKLHKMAQVRQILEAGIEPIMANERVSSGQKDLAASMLEKVKSAVPFTHSDLINMESMQVKNPKATLRDVLPKIKGSGSTPTVKTDADYQALPSGTVFVDPDGNQRKKP